MLIDLKNGGDLLDSDYTAEIVKAFDFSVIEQCVSQGTCGCGTVQR